MYIICSMINYLSWGLRSAVDLQHLMSVIQKKIPAPLPPFEELSAVAARLSQLIIHDSAGTVICGEPRGSSAEVNNGTNG